MGLQRIIVDAWGTKEAARAAAAVAMAAATQEQLSVMSVTVVSHPGQSDEETTVVYSTGS